MRYLHTMIRVSNLEKSLRFYTEGLGFKIVKRSEHEKDRFTLVFLQSESEDPSLRRVPMIELTHNWDTDKYELGNGYGHVAYGVKSISNVQARLKKAGFNLSWGPGLSPSGTNMAFIDDPDGYEIELLEY